MTKYRIVTDKYCGFEVQERILFFFWRQIGFTNTHRTLKLAKDYLNKYKKNKFVVYEE